jgi:hypothetical protein
MGRARDGLLHEPRLLGATNPIISSNVPTRSDGLPPFFVLPSIVQNIAP